MSTMAVVGVIITRNSLLASLRFFSPFGETEHETEHAKPTDTDMRAVGRTLVRLAGWRTKGRTLGECGGKTEATTVVFPSPDLASSPSIRYFSLSPSLSVFPRPRARIVRVRSAALGSTRPIPSPFRSPPPLPARPFPLPNPCSFVCSLSFFLSRSRPFLARAIAKSSFPSAPRRPMVKQLRRGIRRRRQRRRQRRARPIGRCGVMVHDVIMAKLRMRATECPRGTRRQRPGFEVRNTRGGGGRDRRELHTVCARARAFTSTRRPLFVIRPVLHS